MSSKKLIEDACCSHNVGSIDIKSAHIWFHLDYAAGGVRTQIFVNEFRSDEDRNTNELNLNCDLPGNVRYSDIGACNTDWVKRKVSDLLAECTELLIELGVGGCDIKQVVSELAKIRQFAALGSKSYNMARALSSAIAGISYEDQEIWEKYERI